MPLTVTHTISDGLYIVYDGKDCDNYPYRALLVIAGDNKYISEFTTHPNLFSGLTQMNDTLDFKTLGITHYEIYR